VRWCEFYPDPPTPAKSPFDPLEDICRSCPQAMAIVRENHCPFCARGGLQWATPKSVLTFLADPEFLYHYSCPDCGREVYSKDLILSSPSSDAEGPENGGLDG